MSARLAKLVILAAFIAGMTGSAVAEELFKSKRITQPKLFTKHIEGPAVDAVGNLYVVNLGMDGKIGKLKPGSTQPVPFATLPPGSIGSGIRFDREGRMYVADFNGHNVFVFQPGQTVPSVYFQSSDFNQPNDLAIAADGTLYASDPKKGEDAGQVWRITRGPDGKGHGEKMISERVMGKTNGIDLSPDGTTLYVSESIKREIWAYRIDGAKLTAPRRIIRFDSPPNSELDGLRTDVDGRIFVARPLNSTISVITPDQVVLREIPLNGNNPSNLTFGGPDGKTVFVTQVDGRFIESFRVDRPGREPCLQVPAAC